MKIAGGWDHRGRRFRADVERVLARLGHELVDMGARTDESSDYPDFGFRVAEAVARGEADRGLLICGTGIGMSIVANKVAGIRAGVVTDVETARLSRAHNDTNVICIGEEAATGPELEDILHAWLTTPFDGGRHERRIKKITEYEASRGAAPKA